jgi:raffinose/stachyose/melibiose transport system substrate-binding protein
MGGAGAALLLTVGMSSVAAAGQPSTARSRGASTPVTLVVEDGWIGTPGRIPTLEAVAKAFESAHPGVKIVIRSQTFAQLEATSVLSLSAPNPPSVFAVNQGYASLGQLVKDNLVTNLDSYAAKYHWDTLQSPTLLAIDGRQSLTTIGSGHLYGVCVTGDWVGIYYNTDLLKKIGQPVPTTFAEFTHDLALAKTAGIIPIATGAGSGDDLLLHLWWLEMLAQAPSLQYVRNLVDGVGNESWDSPVVINSAKTLVQWADDGYFSPGYSGLPLTAAVAQFAAGKALFLEAGSWITASLTSVEDHVGMIPLPSATSAHGPEGIATGGQLLVIPTHAPHHALAAEFLNFLISQKVARMYLAANQLPATTVPDELTVAKGLTRVVAAGWLAAAKGSAPMPYPDWATPDYFDQLLGLMPELTAHRITPTQFAVQLEQDYSTFRKSLAKS